MVEDQEAQGSFHDEEDVEIVMDEYNQDDDSMGFACSTHPSFQKPVSVATGISISGGESNQSLSSNEAFVTQLTSVLSNGLASANMASSIYNIELDSIEDKPWRHPGTDITDYFNYGFDEQTWRLYCLRQKSLREEAHQSKRIGVYEGSSLYVSLAHVTRSRSKRGPSVAPSSQTTTVSSSLMPADHYFSEEKSHRESSSRRYRSRSRSRSRDSRKSDRKSESSRRTEDRERSSGDRSGDHHSYSSSSSRSRTSGSSRKSSSAYRS